MLDQVHQLFIVTAVKQVVQIFYLANIHDTGLEHVDELFIGIDETRKRLSERVKTAFKALDQHAFHKSAHVVLPGKQCGVFLRVLQVKQGRIPRVLEALDLLNRISEYAIRLIIKRIDNFFGVPHPRKGQALPLEIIAIVFDDFASRTADHHLTQQPVADDLGIFAQLCHVFK